jgi:hypothetical protein
MAPNQVRHDNVCVVTRFSRSSRHTRATGDRLSHPRRGGGANLALLLRQDRRGNAPTVRANSLKTVRSLSGRCLGCGGSELAHDRLLPFGTESTAHAWLHSRCRPAWHVARQAQAIASLTAMGIRPEMVVAHLPRVDPETPSNAGDVVDGWQLQQGPGSDRTSGAICVGDGLTDGAGAPRTPQALADVRSPHGHARPRQLNGDRGQ